MIAKTGAGAAISIASMLFCGQALSADVTDYPPPESGWKFTVVPYLWLAGINGDVAAFGAPEASIDASISDVLKNLDMGLMSVMQARYDRFSISADIFWVKLSAEQDVSLEPLADKVELTNKSLMLTGVAGYSILHEDDAIIDVIAGARFWSVDNELDFSGGIVGNASFDDKETWVDPVVGITGHADISDNFYVTGWALAGGFDVSSDFMWDAMGSIGYRFNDTFSMTVGYRGMGVDYHNDGFVYDIVQHGPIFGGVFEF
jgi:hypothetical protein